MTELVCHLPFRWFHIILSNEARGDYGGFNSALSPNLPPYNQSHRHSGCPPQDAWLGGGSQNSRDPLLVKKDDLHIDIIPVLVQKVLQEVGNTLQSDVSADHNVPEWERPVRWGRPAQTRHPPRQDRGSAQLQGSIFSSRGSKEAQLPSPEGCEAKQWCWQVFRDSSTGKAYGFSPDAAQNPIKSSTVWPSGFMHLTISDIMLVLKCCIIKSLADPYLSLSAHKASS